MRVMGLMVMVSMLAMAHAEVPHVAMAPLPNLTLETEADQTLAQKLVDALNDLSTRVTDCAEAANPQAPEDAADVCLCKFAVQHRALAAQLDDVERLRPQWVGHIVHVVSPHNGMPTSLALPHLRAQVDAVVCE